MPTRTLFTTLSVFVIALQAGRSEMTSVLMRSNGVIRFFSQEIGED
jgi:hypothetical protein